MIKMTYQEVTNMQFLGAVQYLANQALPIKTAYAVKKIADELTRAKKRIAEEYQKDIIEKFSKKNPDGSIAHPIGEDGKPVTDQFDPIDDKEGLLKAQNDFGAKTLEINRPKLVVDQLGHSFTMSAAQLVMLDPLFTDLSVVEGLEQAVSETPKEGA